MDFQSLHAIIQYQFSNKDLLRLALTHRSAAAENNERLEFLGDSLLNCIIAAALYTQIPAAPEGDLSAIRANLVRGKTLAEMAQEFFLGDYLILGPGEMKSGGVSRESILSGTMEAIIGAIYQDSNFEQCETTVLQWYQSRLSTLQSAAHYKDPKTQLQELLQARKLPVPRYELLTVSDKAQNHLFIVQCHIPDLALVAKGKGSSRRKAEQAAANKILELMYG